LTSVPPLADVLQQIETWESPRAAAAVVTPSGLVASHGDVEHPFALASVTKLLVADAVLVAVEEEALSLDQAAGPPGSTVAHLLAHASGLGPDGGVVAAPGTRRIYSNAGFEALAATLEAAAGMTMADYLHAAVVEPLDLSGTRLDGSAAHGAVSTVADLARFAAELLGPRLIAPETLARATSPVFPDLAGVLPGFGRQDPNPWGLGFELRGEKRPHWTGTGNSPATFGHFGRSGTFLWVDPVAAVALVVLTDRAFGPWSAEAWPRLSDSVLDAAS
jgi:CubicO group peptidase (beta-lactamase class C family)